MSDFRFEAWDHITGSNQGTYSDADNAMEIIHTIQRAENSTYYNDFYPPIAAMWQSLAEDLAMMQTHDTHHIDIEFYSLNFQNQATLICESSEDK